MSFANTRNNDLDGVDLNRFCNHTDYNIIGGASKLIKNMIPLLDKNIEYISSFSDNSYSNGNVYGKLGFVLDNILSPDYKYIVNETRIHKS